VHSRRQDPVTIIGGENRPSAKSAVAAGKRGGRLKRKHSGSGRSIHCSSARRSIHEGRGGLSRLKRKQRGLVMACMALPASEGKMGPAPETYYFGGFLKMKDRLRQRGGQTRRGGSLYTTPDRKRATSGSKGVSRGEEASRLPKKPGRKEKS